ncbi:MAG: hypothetical protein U0359_15315 [Byssovorax sp.]
MVALDQLGGIEEDEAEVYATRARILASADQRAAATDVRERGARRVREIAERISNTAWRERFLHAVAAHRELLTGP